MAKGSPNLGDKREVGTTDLTVREFVSGQKLFRRYTLVRVLGRGGMGIVWLARDGDLERDVALKFLPEMFVHDPAVLADLKRETRRSLELTHPHIVRIHDFVQDSDSACISMEYVDGDTLSGLRAAKPSKVFEAPELEVWLKQWCDAMDYAHRYARVVHCDLKPANLMVNSKGTLKITDFGIARSLSDSATRLTVSRSHTGTLVYMSPQQLNGERPSHLDDIYSIGATLYELLTGKPPFYHGQIDRQIRERIPLPMALRRQELEVESAFVIPKIWEDTVAACLAKSPSQRPQSAGELAERLMLTRAIQDRPATKVTEQPIIKGPKKRRIKNGFRSIIKIFLSVFNIFQRGCASVKAIAIKQRNILQNALASIKAAAARNRRNPFLYCIISVAALIILLLSLYFGSPRSREWLLRPVLFRGEMDDTARFQEMLKKWAESSPVPSATAARYPSPSPSKIPSVQQTTLPAGKIPYSTEDVDHLIDYVHELHNSGNATLTLRLLESRGASDDLTSAGVLAEMALLYETEHDLDRTEQMWSKVLQLGPSSGALYELAVRKKKELPPELRPDRGLEPSKEPSENTAPSTSSAETPVLSASPEIATTGAAPEHAPLVKNGRPWQAWIEDFVKQFVEANSSPDVDREVLFYAPNAQIFEEGPKTPDSIRHDIETYKTTWPVRSSSISGAVQVTEKVPNQEYIASFKQDYYVENPARGEWVKGTVAVDLSIIVVDGLPKISSIKQNVLSREKGTGKPPALNNVTAQPSATQAAPSSPSPRNNRTWQAWIGEFVRQYESSSEQGVNSQLALYASVVRYFGDEQRDHTYIRTDVEKYRERWPVRRGSIEGDIDLQEKIPDKEYAASYKLNFYAESAPRAVWTKGQFAIDLDITVVDGVPNISGIKEKTSRQERGSLKAVAPNAASPSKPVARVEASGGTNLNSLVFAPQPIYPSEARQKRVAGSGQFRIGFDREGKATTVEVVKSTGHQMLDTNTINTLKRWRARPGMPSTMVVPITYTKP